MRLLHRIKYDDYRWLIDVMNDPLIKILLIHSAAHQSNAELTNVELTITLIMSSFARVTVITTMRIAAGRLRLIQTDTNYY
jgi:hypothetical protein